MRLLVDARNALRAAMAARGDVLPEMGVSPGFEKMRSGRPVYEGDLVRYSAEAVSKRETSKPKSGLVGNRFHGVNQGGEEVKKF
jgi:acyl dehydratase